MGQVVKQAWNLFLFFLIFLPPLIFLFLEYLLLFFSWSNATLSLSLHDYHNHVFTHNPKALCIPLH